MARGHIGDMVVTYLVTGVGGPAGRAVADELLRLGRGVVGADTFAIGPAPFPTEILPLAGSSRFVPAVFELCRRHHAEVVVPTLAEELPVLAVVKQTAARGGVAIAVGDPLAVEISLDRWLSFQCLQMMGVPVPKTLLSGEVVSAAQVHAQLGLPVVRKPRIRRATGGVTLHRALDTILHGISEDRFVLQEFLPGTEFAAQLYLSPTGGVAHGITDPEVSTLAVQAMRAIGLQGPAVVGVRRRVDGRPVVLGVSAGYGPHSGLGPAVIEALMHEHEVHATI